MGRAHPRGAAVRAPGARRPVGGRLHPRRPRVGAARSSCSRRELGVEPSAFVLVYTSDTLTAGTPEWLAAVTAATRDVAARPARHRVSCRTSSRRTRSAPTATPRTTSCSSTSRRTTPPTRSRASRPLLHEAPGLTRPGRPAAPRSTATSRPSPSATSSAPRSSRCRSPRWRCCSCSAASSRRACRSRSAARPCSSRSPGSSSSRRSIPMSIFVLNLATLLGLGLGVDYSLLMTSRFREELAHRDGPDRVAEAVRVTVATAGSGGVLLGPDRAARPARPRAVRVHDPALGRHRRGDRRGPRGARRRSRSCRRSSRSSARASTGCGIRLDHAPSRHPTAPWARLARRVMRHPVAVLVPTLDAAARPRAAVPPRPVQRARTPRSCRPRVPSREAYDVLAREFGEGEFAPLVLAVRTTGDATTPDNLATLYDYSRRLAADPRVSRVDVARRRRSARSRSTSTSCSTASPGGPPDRFVATALGATTKGDLTAFTVYTPYGPNRDEGRALVRELRDPASPLAPPAGVTVLVGGGAADVDDVVSRVWADFPRTAAVHRRARRSSCCSSSSARSCCRSRRS